ncbi:MAG: sulfatase, partial [Lentisphaerae bacterium]|nr:sulfatase [Lentisphaerota bacterium]
YFGAGIPPDMLGRPLRDTIAADKPVREAALFGVFGGHVNITDGRYVYMRAPVRPDSSPLFNYTLMPSHMRRMFSPAELQQAELAGPFPFTKGCRLLRVPAKPFMNQAHQFGSLLYDLQTDPEQQHPLRDRTQTERMTEQLISLMREHDAPTEQYERLGLPVKERNP